MDVVNILTQILSELKTISNKLDKIAHERDIGPQIPKKADILKEIEDAKRRKTAEIEQLLGKSRKN